MQHFVLDELRESWHREPPIAANRDEHQEFYLPSIPENIKGTKKEIAKQFAVYLLRGGAEVEHSLLVQYLYAAYSIDERKGDLENNLALQWKTYIRLVAREEMAHLVTVQNLLLSLGQEIYLNRAAMDEAASALPLQFALERLTLKSIAKYVLFESPLASQCDERYVGVLEQIHKKFTSLSRIRGVGSIYAALYWLFMESDELDSDWPFPEAEHDSFINEYGGLHIDKSDFGKADEYLDHAAGADEWEVFESDAHVDAARPRESALASLRWIMAQGEGPNAIEESHFVRFVGIYKELKAQRDELAKSKKLSKRRKLRCKYESMRMRVPTNPLLRSEGKRRFSRARRLASDSLPGTSIKHPRTKLWAELVNARYQLMILHIYRALKSSKRGAEVERRKFAAFAITEMEFVKRIGQILPFMDRKVQHKKKKPKKKCYQPLVGGAVFEEVRVPPDETARLKACREYIYTSDRCIADLADVLRKTGTHPPHPLAENTEDLPTLAQGPQLLDAIARQNDVIRETLDLQ